ncbi:MAG TPA: tetratricopeptide repeat protein, partial [Thermoanaerobaculia bacterium]|nr:tetratricopeptide repeat protein [Thermoanaerobaculia bacterium]
ERSMAPALLAELMGHEPGRRLMLIRNARRFRNLSLCGLLLDRCREVSPDDPRSGEEWAALALRLTDLLDPGCYGPGLIEDFRARGWALIANARRIAGDFLESEQAFAHAEDHLRRGTRDPLERAQKLILKAVLRRGQRRFEEAERLLRRTLSICLWAGDSRRSVETMITLSLVYREAGGPERAIRLLREASELPMAATDARLMLAIHHNLAGCLLDAGKFLEAEGVLLHNRELYDRLNIPGTDLRRNWIEAALARELGRTDQAEILLTRVRDSCVEHGMATDAALATLEMALLYSQAGRVSEAAEPARAALGMFSALGVPRDALAAFILLHRAGAA